MSSATPIPPTGIYVPVPTFFSAPASSSSYSRPLDVVTQSAHTLHLARAGITGIVYLGSTGEAVALSDEERNQVLASQRKTLEENGFKNYSLIAGTAGYCVEQTIRQCEDGAKHGANWMLCLAPGFFAPQTFVEGLSRWYEAVADHSPIPILIYHYPGVSNNVAVPPAVYERLAAHPNVVGCKLSHGDLSSLAQITLSSSEHITKSTFRVFTGLGQILTPVLHLGGAGAIDGFAGIFPHVMVQLIKNFDAIQSSTGDRDDLEATQRQLQGDVSRAWELLVKWGIPGIKEAISRELGMGAGDGTRLPLFGGMPDGAWKQYEPAFEKLRILEKDLAAKRQAQSE